MKSRRKGPSDIEQYIIDFVREFRLQKGMTQAALAVILNTSASFIGNVESLHHEAKYNINHLNLLALHFKISPKVFMPANPVECVLA
jgi:transcriptional regulator with XRE-family HTH domain